MPDGPVITCPWLAHPGACSTLGAAAMQRVSSATAVVAGRAALGAPEGPIGTLRWADQAQGGVLSLDVHGAPDAGIDVWVGPGPAPARPLSGPRVDPLAPAAAMGAWGPAEGADGRGAERLAVRLLAPALPLVLRAPVAADAADVWTWTNDPASVAAAFRGRPVEWGEHVQWFAARLADPTHRWHLGVLGGLPVGLVRLDGAADAWHLGFMVDPTQRRRGLAPRLIGAALAQQPARSARVVGECRADNRSSAGAMLAAGMAEAEPVRAGTRRFVYPPPAGEGASSPAQG